LKKFEFVERESREPSDKKQDYRNS